MGDGVAKGHGVRQDLPTDAELAVLCAVREISLATGWGSARVSKAALARRTGLSQARASAAVDGLIGTGLLSVRRWRSSSGQRVPNEYSLTPRAEQALARAALRGAGEEPADAPQV